jgi:hypothetical protein
MDVLDDVSFRVYKEDEGMSLWMLLERCAKLLYFQYFISVSQF